MNINDYSIKVKNLANVLASIKAPINDEDLMAGISSNEGSQESAFSSNSNRNKK